PRLRREAASGDESVEALGNEESGVDPVRLVGEVGTVGSDKQESMSSCGGLVRRGKISPQCALCGGEVEIVDLDTDAVGVRQKYVIRIGVPDNDFLAPSDAGK